MEETATVRVVPKASWPPLFDSPPATELYTESKRQRRLPANPATEHRLTGIRKVLELAAEGDAILSQLAAWLDAVHDHTRDPELTKARKTLCGILDHYETEAEL